MSLSKEARPLIMGRRFAGSALSLRITERGKHAMDGTEQKHYYACRRLRILNYLTMQGFRYEYILPDMQDPNKQNWMFLRTEELTNALDRYYEAASQRRKGKIGRAHV